jgi:hypothetical protein
MGTKFWTDDVSRDAREVCRDLCVMRGSMPEVATKTVVWVWHAGHWTKAKVKRRLPGGVYWVECICYPFNGLGITVSANTFGGAV